MPSTIHQMLSDEQDAAKKLADEKAAILALAEEVNERALRLLDCLPDTELHELPLVQRELLESYSRAVGADSSSGPVQIGETIRVWRYSDSMRKRSAIGICGEVGTGFLSFLVSRPYTREANEGLRGYFIELAGNHGSVKQWLCRIDSTLRFLLDEPHA